MEQEEIAVIITRAHLERAAIADAKTRLAALEQRLLALAPGKYQGDGAKDRVQVILPSAAIKPAPEAIEFLRAELETPDFKKLFERVVSYKPRKSFRDLARAVLSKVRAEKVIAACETPGAPYLLWK